MGKNVKKVISLVLVFAMILTGMTLTGFDAKAADAANDTSATAEYEIYPTPRSVVYQDSSLPWQIRQTLSMTARSTRQHRNV